jgi:hypothetical protein
VLKCIVEDHNVDALSDRFANPAHPIGARDDWNSRVQSLVNDYLVAIVAT